MHTVANSETDDEPLWLALLFFMGGEVCITAPPRERLPVAGKHEASILALEMVEAIEDGTTAPIKALCGIYFRSPVNSGDLSCYYLRNDGLANHPEAVGFFIPSSLGWGHRGDTLEA